MNMSLPKHHHNHFAGPRQGRRFLQSYQRNQVIMMISIIMGMLASVQAAAECFTLNQAIARDSIEPAGWSEYHLGNIFLARKLGTTQCQIENVQGIAFNVHEDPPLSYSCLIPGYDLVYTIRDLSPSGIVAVLDVVLCTDGKL